jgi:single-stranded-DNA-specific exonuclease
MSTKTLSTWLSLTQNPFEWLEPKLKDLSDHTLIKDRDIVISRLATAIRKGESICAFGDFDCDGMTSTVILVEAVRLMGGRITPIIAQRSNGGYGFSSAALDKVLAGGFKLLATLDCGSSDHDRLEKLQCDAIIVDHHLIPDRPFPKQVVAFLNPHREDCPSEFKWLASVGLIWSVVQGLIKEMGLQETIDIKQWLDVLAIGTVADVAPLKSDNRIIVRAGFKSIAEAKRPGIRALLEMVKLTPGPNLKVTAKTIGFNLAPGLNAPGRLGSAQIIIDLLLERDLEEARKIAARVKEIWDKRRVITEKVTAEAIEMIEQNGWGREPSICLGKPEWEHGVVGIVAARLVDKYKVPVACMGSEGKGSLRGPQGSTLHKALTACKDHLVRFGGHEAAAGAQVTWEKLNDFREAFKAFHSLPQTNPLHSSNSEVPLDLFLDLDPSDRIEDVERDLYLLEPCGQGNPKPILVVHGIIKNAKEVRGGHGKFELKMTNGKTLPCFVISKGEWLTEHVGEKVKVCGDLRKNEWKGKTTVEMFVQSIDVE